MWLTENYFEIWVNASLKDDDVVPAGDDAPADAPVDLVALQADALVPGGGRGPGHRAVALGQRVDATGQKANGEYLGQNYSIVLWYSLLSFFYNKVKRSPIEIYVVIYEDNPAAKSQ